MSEEKSENIYQAMVAIQGDISAVGKDTRSPNLNYTYRSADDVTDMLHPLLVKHGVTVVPTVHNCDQTDYTSQRGGRMLHALLTMEFRYYATDGSYVSVVTIGEGADASDKSCNKAMTQARKNADCQVFTIPTGDEDPEYNRPDMAGDPDVSAYKPPKRTATSTSPGRREASEKQKKLLYAVSMSRAEKLLEERIAANLPLKYEDANALRGSIAKHAAEHVGVGDELHSDEIDAIKDAIEKAQINDAGETVIPSEPF